MTESELGGALLYIRNHNNQASETNYAHLDTALSIIEQAAQNLLDISQDINSKIVPRQPLRSMMIAGIGMYEKTYGQGSYKGSVAVWVGMVEQCDRDARLPKKDTNSFGDMPPF